MSDNTSQDRNPVTRLIIWLWKFFVRLVLVLIFGVVIGATLYYIGLPNIYGAQFREISENSDRLNEMEAVQSSSNEQISERMSALQERIVNLEIFRDDSNERIGGFQDQLDSATAAQTTQVANTSSEINQISEELKSISNELEELNQEIANLTQDLKSVEATSVSSADELSADVEDNAMVISAISDTLKVSGTPLENLAREVKILKVLDLVTRSRLSIYEENFGLAKRDIQNALDLLQQIEQDLPLFQALVIEEIENRLSGVMANLPDEPVLAAGDLEFAWQFLVQGLPESPSEVTLTITSTVGITGTVIAPEPTISPSTPGTEGTSPTATPVATPTSTPQP